MAQQKMKVRVIKAEAPASTTKQVYDDPFKDGYGAEGDIIQPPYNIRELKLIADHSTILNQCVEAYCTNIVKFGIQPQYCIDYNSASDPIKQKMDQEWQRLVDFVRHLHFDEAPEKILEWMLSDREKTGNGFLEILRDTLGKPAGIEYADAEFMRVCTYTVPDQVEYTIIENGSPKKTKRWRKFRKYVQVKSGKKVWFKEYGDNRIMNSATGKFDENTPEHLRATEIIHFKVGSGTYGVPRWIGHVVSLYGARKAEELNYLYFKQGRHIPAAIVVENGMLSADSEAQLQEYMNGIEGVENAHKFLLLEAEGIETESITDSGQEQKNITPVKVQIKSLAEILQEDALFLEYDQKTRDKLRSSFRLPPLYTGESQDYNKATADTARKITEEQVFQPNRNDIIDKLNTLFLQDLEIYYVELMLKGPDFSDPMEIAKILGPFINAGAAAPNDLRDLLGKILGKTLDEWGEEFNQPLQLILRDMQQATTIPIMMQKAKEQNNDLINILKDLRDIIEELSA